MKGGTTVIRVGLFVVLAGPLIPLRCITATGISKNRSDTFLYLMICYFSQSKKLEHGIGLKIEPDHSTLALNEGS